MGQPRCHRVGVEGMVKKIQWGAFLRSVCIRIGDYAHTGCRVTNAFKKRLTETITTLTVGVVGVRRFAGEFADIWSTLLAYVRHVAPADRLFQKTTKVGQFDISTSMLFLTDPKYHVRIVHGPRNHFPNTMFGGVLLWTPIEVLLRNMRSLSALSRQKTPLTNGQVQEAKTHCRKIGEAWLPLGWKSTPWVHWTVAHCGAVLQKCRNLYVFSSIPAEHRHKPFKVAVKNSMRGRCFRRPHVSRRGLTHVLNTETLDVGLLHRAAGQRLAVGEATRDRRKRQCMCASETKFEPVRCIWCPSCTNPWRRNTPPPQKGCRKRVPAH